jgi:hypothetical protein
MSIRSRAALGFAVALFVLVAIAGCGDGNSATVASDSQTAATQTAVASGPRGALDFTGVGPVTQGTSMEKAREAFGSPDRTQRVPGCELSGPNAPEVVIWTWDLEDGDFILNFDASSGALKSYRTTSSKLPTSAGNHVGDSFQSLRDSYGPTLRPLKLGSETPSPQSGIWFVRKNSKSQLTFTIAGGRVRTIAGGLLEICE